MEEGIITTGKQIKEIIDTHQIQFLTQLFQIILQTIGERLSTCHLSCAIVYVEHKNITAFIQSIVSDLKLAGINTHWELHPGASQRKVDKQIKDSDVILVIGTPLFKEVADASPKGSILNIIIANLFTSLRYNKYKIIPILVEGNESNALPLFLQDPKSIDWRQSTPIKKLLDIT